jgi:hypothetical protein
MAARPLAAVPAPTPVTLSRNPAELRRALRRAEAERRQWRLRYAELHVAYVELLANARASVASADRGEAAPTRYIAAHLHEVGLAPATGAVPAALVAHGLAVARDLADGLPRRPS